MLFAAKTAIVVVNTIDFDLDNAIGVTNDNVARVGFNPSRKSFMIRLDADIDLYPITSLLLAPDTYLSVSAFTFSVYFTSVSAAGFALKIAIEVSLQIISTFLLIAMSVSNLTVRSLPELLTVNVGLPEIGDPSIVVKGLH